MSKHTPGPWTAYKRPEPVGFAEWEIYYGTDTECVAEVVHEEANARLIAAAPELLEALQAVIRNDAENRDEFGLSVNVCKQAIAAIAKATGE